MLPRQQQERKYSYLALRDLERKLKLVSLSVTNYRSIARAHRVPIASTTVLVGKNNEGKSNVLHALTLAMELIREHARHSYLPPRLRAIRRAGTYDWERDFPVHLQARKGAANCKLRLEFALTADEVEEFRREIKSSLNGTLPIEITISKNGDIDFKVVKKGPGSGSLQKKSSRIAEFIGSKIDFTYIPAVRTAGEAVRVVEEMVQEKLRELEDDPEYQDALHKIAEIQRPLLEDISERITAPLRGFIPQVEEVEVKISDEARRRALRRCDIIINDGTPTSIERKGDGVKSLAAISLLRGEPVSNRVSILALEEPESHLHPGAIQRLKEVIEEISCSHQVVLTTHCPLFVNRLDLASNVIIEQNSARPVKNLAEVRESLGVLASDNLMHARLVLIVEGAGDKAVLDALLASRSPTIKSAMKSGLLVLDHLNGGTNLTYKASLVQNMLCSVHAFLDNDEVGRKAAQEALDSGHLRYTDLHLAKCKGMSESELEDCLDFRLYQSTVETTYGVKLACKEFRNERKWSVRMKDTFNAQGKLWNNKVAAQLKATVGEIAQNSPEKALSQHKRSAIDALVSSLEEKLQNGPA